MYLLFKMSLKEPRAMGSVAALCRAVPGCPSSAQHRDVWLLAVLCPHRLSVGGGMGEGCLPVAALSVSIPVVSILLGAAASMLCQRSTSFFRMPLSRGESCHQI